MKFMLQEDLLHFWICWVWQRPLVVPISILLSFISNREPLIFSPVHSYRERRLQLSAQLPAKCGHLTNFCSMRWKQKGKVWLLKSILKGRGCDLHVLFSN